MKKRLVALLVILALSMTFTVVAMANPQNATGEIEFTDGRGGSGGPGTGRPLPPGWEDIYNRGVGIDFYTHNLEDIEDHAPATFAFHTNRALNNAVGNVDPGATAPWDPLHNNNQRSLEAVRMHTAGDNNAVLSVAVGGFFRVLPGGGQGARVLQGTVINLNRFAGDVGLPNAPGGGTPGYIDNDGGAVAAEFHQTVNGLVPAGNGGVGIAMPVNNPLNPGDDAVILYEAQLAQAERATVLSAGQGQARAVIQWTYVGEAPPAP